MSIYNNNEYFEFDENEPQLYCKILSASYQGDLENLVNGFMQERAVFDVKFACKDDLFTAMVLYYDSVAESYDTN